MIPVDQTVLVGDPRGIPGNCVQAAVASIYELPLDAVPHFILFDDWVKPMQQWLREHDADFLPVWNSRGYDRSYDFGARPLLAFGMSPRGVSHALVWQDGQVLHDPHPTRAGFSDGPDELWFISDPRQEPHHSGKGDRS